MWTQTVVEDEGAGNPHFPSTAAVEMGPVIGQHKSERNTTVEDWVQKRWAKRNNQRTNYLC
jgi:hypothetical protein